MRRLYRFKKKEDETVIGYCIRTARAARTIWTKMKLPTLSEVIPESMWRAMGWVCNTRPNAVLVSSVHAFEWRSTTWWQNQHAEKMREDPYNHTCWKHTLGWHNRRCLWDKIPTEWSGKQKWCERKICCTAEDQRDFVTFALSSVKHSVAHRPRIGERSKPVKEKKRAEDTGTSRHVDLLSYGRHHGADVW